MQVMGECLMREGIRAIKEKLGNVLWNESQREVLLFQFSRSEVVRMD